MAKPLTDISIKNLQPTDKRQEVPDGKIGGLYLVIQPSGARSWALRYRMAGQPKKLTLGKYPGLTLAAARQAAQQALGQIAHGNDPAASKHAAKATARAARPADDVVDKIVAEFIERHAKPKTRDWRETERRLNKDVVAAWRGRRLSEIRRADICRMLDVIVDRGSPINANRVLTQLGKMCRWAVGRGIIEHNPTEGIEPPGEESRRDRVLDDDELRQVWAAAGGLGFPFGPITRLLILLGQRRGEIAGMRWEEVNLATGRWTMPPERVKNHRQHAIVLPPSALAILVEQPRFAGSKFVFSPGTTAPSGFSRAKRRLDDLLLKGGAAPLPFVLHDVRRSVVSGMARIGIDLHIIERTVNHLSGSFGGIVSVYQKHGYEPQVTAALQRWADHVERLVSGEPAGNVVELRGAGAAA